MINMLKRCPKKVQLKKPTKQDTAADSISVLYGPHKITQIFPKIGNNASHAAFTQHSQQQQTQTSIATTVTQMGRIFFLPYVLHISD